MICKIAIFTFKQKAATKLAQYYFLGLIILFLTNTLFFTLGLKSELEDYHQKQQHFQANSTLEKTFVIKPPLLTTFISSSDQSILPNWVLIKPFEVVDNGGVKEPSSLLSNETILDWRLIIGVWCSLATMLFACDSLSDRRSNRLLRLLWSFPITRGQYFWGTFFGQLSVTYIPLVFIIILSLLLKLIFIVYLGFPVMITDLLFKVVLVLIATLPYLTIFTIIGWIASIIWKAESSAILGSITIWTLLVWMWPTLGLMTGQLTSDLAHYQDLSKEWTKIESEALGTISTSALRSIVNQDISNFEKEQRIEQLEKKIELDLDKDVCKVRENSIKLKDNYRLRRQQQTKHAISLTTLSPFGQWKQLLDEIATSGYDGYLYFLSLGEQYSKSFGIYTDEIKSTDQFNAEYKSTGMAGYGGFTLNIRSGKVYDHIILPESAPDFKWKQNNNSTLVYHFFIGTGKLLLINVLLILIVMLFLFRINLV